MILSACCPRAERTVIQDGRYSGKIYITLYVNEYPTVNIGLRFSSHRGISGRRGNNSTETCPRLTCMKYDITRLLCRLG